MLTEQYHQPLHCSFLHLSLCDMPTLKSNASRVEMCSQDSPCLSFTLAHYHVSFLILGLSIWRPRSRPIDKRVDMMLNSPKIIHYFDNSHSARFVNYHL